jgi:Serine dehydrogenase proteinase
MDSFSLASLFIVIASPLQPSLQARLQAMQRARQAAAIEKERESCVTTMADRQETRSFFSVPVSRMIDLGNVQHATNEPAPSAWNG